MLAIPFDAKLIGPFHICSLGILPAELLGHISRPDMEPWLPRPRERVCLQDGLKLDLNRLARKGFIRFGTNIVVRGITWTHSYWGEIASGTISFAFAMPSICRT